MSLVDNPVIGRWGYTVLHVVKQARNGGGLITYEDVWRERPKPLYQLEHYRLAHTRWGDQQDELVWEEFSLANITPHLRRIFVADPGKKIAYIDLQAAESKAVGYISGDQAYIDLCDHGDAHTAVARLVWQDLPWTGDIKKDKEIAKNTPFYRDLSIRDMAKKGGHGTNYFGTPPTMAGHLKMPVDTIAHFQDLYFQAFPGIPAWHKRVIQAIQLDHSLTTCFGRKRLFFGRATEASTWRGQQDSR